MSPIEFHCLQREDTTLLSVPELVEHITPSWFDLNWWRGQGQQVHSAPGRGESYFVDIELDDQPLAMVWRHYRRGGLVSRFSEDSYLWQGMTKTRPWQELNLTADLYARGLPVPRPLAAQIIREGLFYRADLLTERLPKVRSMAQQLAKAPAETPWVRIGQIIARFHAVGLDHVDLNIRNILVADDQQVFLIDFDRCCLRSPKNSWQKSNLDRLLRSIQKEFSNSEMEQGWQQLLQGYSG
ncbi:MAG: 3-deoxy-D-manno-octulosonic acid kinase [Motiliproteus sp.]|nr:3-deoxy-D-manno-octulosonic acid kinase [Motiliproteus sp.]MCW9053757.1 3-deoxy-D-manno-octulosonic acid kinase [Motiliproteus sp.]